MNLYMHYAFDIWMKREFPQIHYVRYADDGVIHCRTLAEAKAVEYALKDRLQQCGLQMHSDKSRIVYCKDDSRRKSYDNVSYTFLGYTFKERLAKTRKGRYFSSFSPAISTSAKCAIFTDLRELKITRKTNRTLEEIAKLVNAKMRGWYNYFGRYYKSEFGQVFDITNPRLLKGVQNMLKRLRGKRKAQAWLYNLAIRESELFYHWGLGYRPRRVDQ